MQKDLFGDTLRHLKAVEADLLKKLDGVRSAIRSFEDGEEPETSKGVVDNSETSVLNTTKIPYADQFDTSWSLGHKFLFLLKMENRFLHFREAGELIVKLDGKGDTSSVARKLSSSTQKLKKEGTIVKHQATHQNRDTFWGSPKWLNEDGTIKDGHEYNKDFLASYEDKSKPLFEI